jgi:hypothetical protein
MTQRDRRGMRMWASLGGFLRVGRGRKAAVATISPLVARTRARMLIADAIWLDPYMIGFLTMLITLIARREAGITTSQALADVQSSAWSEITGLSHETVGDEIAFLNAAHDDAFEIGCRDALVFGQALYGESMSIDSDVVAMWDGVSQGPPLEPKFARSAPELLQRDSAIEELWADCFDARVAEIGRFRVSK